VPFRVLFSFVLLVVEEEKKGQLERVAGAQGAASVVAAGMSLSERVEATSAGVQPRPVFKCCSFVWFVVGIVGKLEHIVGAQRDASAVASRREAFREGCVKFWRFHS
jgi:hypothetical protein